MNTHKKPLGQEGSPERAYTRHMKQMNNTTKISALNRLGIVPVYYVKTGTYQWLQSNHRRTNKNTAFLNFRADLRLLNNQTGQQATGQVELGMVA